MTINEEDRKSLCNTEEEIVMLIELFGMALFAGSVVLKAKEEAKKEAKRKQREWNEYSTNEKIDEMLNGAETYFEGEAEELKRSLKKRLRLFSDDEIRKALRNTSLPDWKRELVEEEADRRGIS